MIFKFIKRIRSNRLRAKFAGLAMQGLLAANEPFADGGIPLEKIVAVAAIIAAERLMKELENYENIDR